MLARYPDQATSVVLSVMLATPIHTFLPTRSPTSYLNGNCRTRNRDWRGPLLQFPRVFTGRRLTMSTSKYPSMAERFGSDHQADRALSSTPTMTACSRKRPRTTQTIRLETGSPSRLMVRDGTGHEQVFQRVDPVIPSPAELADFVGRYTSSEVAAHYDVSLTDGRLVVHLGGSDPLLPSEDGDEILVPTSKDAFSIGGLGVRFLREEGRVTAMTISPSRAARFRFTKSFK